MVVVGAALWNKRYLVSIHGVPRTADVRTVTKCKFLYPGEKNVPTVLLLIVQR